MSTKPPLSTFASMIRDELHRKSLEKSGFRVVSDHEDQATRERIAARHPPGHCWHLVPREDDITCPLCETVPCACKRAVR